jgi:hypothetical protein
MEVHVVGIDLGKTLFHLVGLDSAHTFRYCVISFHVRADVLLRLWSGGLRLKGVIVGWQPGAPQIIQGSCPLAASFRPRFPVKKNVQTRTKSILKSYCFFGSGWR